MRVFLGTPQSQIQASHVEGMDVLISFALWGKWMLPYIHSYGAVLIDSGAYSELSGYTTVDVAEYADFVAQYGEHAVACAGLDDISGDWRRSLDNYERVSGTFPTFHDSDPPDLLDELVALARERGNWLGIGLVPPREGKNAWVRSTLERIPEGIHVHGWALGLYAHLPRLDSFDSTNWFRDSWKVLNACPWLTPSEALEVIVKKYKRRIWGREPEDTDQAGLFDA